MADVFDDGSRPGTADPSPRAARLQKRPHGLHRCQDVGELVRELAVMGIDVTSLAYEFLKPSARAGILVVGSLAWRIATEVSDLDVMVLIAGADALKNNRKREISGNAVRYLPSGPGTLKVSLFMSGVEIDLTFAMNPACATDRAPGHSVSPADADRIVPDDLFLTCLASGWVVEGEPIVRGWRTHYGVASFRLDVMAREFTSAAKNLEDLEAGIGLAKGHVPGLGASCVNRLMHALLAYKSCYSTSSKWMLRVDRLIREDAEVREALIQGRELLFPTLLEADASERAYVDRVRGYCRVVGEILSREEGMADILTMAKRTFDIEL